MALSPRLRAQDRPWLRLTPAQLDARVVDLAPAAPDVAANVLRTLADIERSFLLRAARERAA